MGSVVECVSRILKVFSVISVSAKSEEAYFRRDKIMF